MDKRLALDHSSFLSCGMNLIKPLKDVGNCQNSLYIIIFKMTKRVFEEKKKKGKGSYREKKKTTKVSCFGIYKFAWDSQNSCMTFSAHHLNFLFHIL